MGLVACTQPRGILIIGGRYHGKYQYVYQHMTQNILVVPSTVESPLGVVDLFDQPSDVDQSANIAALEGGANCSPLTALYNIHHLGNYSPQLLKKCNIFIGDEVGLGVVPIDPKARQLRDDIGRLYQQLASQCSVVIRMWYGQPLFIKGNSELLDACSLKT